MNFDKVISTIYYIFGDNYEEDLKHHMWVTAKIEYLESVDTSSMSNQELLTNIFEAWEMARESIERYSGGEYVIGELTTLFRLKKKSDLRFYKVIKLLEASRPLDLISATLGKR